MPNHRCEIQENKAYDVVQSQQGDIFFLRLNGEKNILELFKFDNDFNLIWNKPIDKDLHQGNFVLFDDKIMIVSSTFSATYNLMLDFEGNVLWEKIHSALMVNYTINRGFKTINGDVLISGSSIPNDSTKSDGYLYKISEEGEFRWETIVSDTFNSNYSSIVEMENGELFGIGTKLEYQTASYFATVTKFDDTGNVIFQKTIDNDNYLFGEDILIYNDLIFMLCTTSSHVQDIMLAIRPPKYLESIRS